MHTEEFKVIRETLAIAKKKGFRARHHGTQAQVQQWLRDRHHIHIIISRGKNHTEYFYNWIIFDKHGAMFENKFQFTDYEYALEAALLEAMKMVKK